MSRHVKQNIILQLLSYLTCYMPNQLDFPATDLFVALFETNELKY